MRIISILALFCFYIPLGNKGSPTKYSWPWHTIVYLDRLEGLSPRCNPWGDKSLGYPALNLRDILSRVVTPTDSGATAGEHLLSPTARFELTHQVSVSSERSEPKFHYFSRSRSISWAIVPLCVTSMDVIRLLSYVCNIRPTTPMHPLMNWEGYQHVNG